MIIEPEEIRSTLFITDKPWRSRTFSIEDKTDNDYCEEDDDTHDDNENKGDIDRGSEGTSSITNAKKERYFTYKKDTKTYRIAVPFKDSIIKGDEEDIETSDDSRNGGKLEENMSQENILGGESIYNSISKWNCYSICLCIFFIGEVSFLLCIGNATSPF